MTPDEAYLEFEEIHPFVDGNGRAGKIIFNWLADSLGDPKMPPNFWGIYNP
jgi:fido (protein-threonine AMPylation protein)